MPAKKPAAAAVKRSATKSGGNKKSSDRKLTTAAKKAGSSAKKTTGTRQASGASRKTTGAAQKRSARSRAADRTHINVNQSYELRDWSERLGVSGAKLKKLVREHGTGAAVIRKAIASSKKRSRSADRSRINVHEPYELRYWTKALKVTGERLKELVKQHGPSAAGIRKSLGMT